MAIGSTRGPSANCSLRASWSTARHSSANPDDVLHAYDARNLQNELYNSNQAGNRDQFGTASHFGTPLIVNGKVYVGTNTNVTAFGLLGN